MNLFMIITQKATRLGVGIFEILLLIYACYADDVQIDYAESYQYSIPTFTLKRGYEIEFKAYIGKDLDASQQYCYIVLPSKDAICCVQNGAISPADETCSFDDGIFAINRTVTRKEFRQYVLSVKENLIDCVFYILDRLAADTDKTKEIYAFLRTEVRTYHASVYTPFIVYFYCPKTAKSPQVSLRREKVSIPFTKVNTGIDPDYVLLRVPLNPSSVGAQQLDCYYRLESVPVTINVIWTQKPIDTIEYIVKTADDDIEIVEVREHKSIQMEVDKDSVGVNVTCHVSPETKTVFWSRNLNGNHVAIQSTTSATKLNCTRCQFYFIRGYKHKASLFIMTFSVDPDDVAEIYCMTSAINFMPVAFIIGPSAETEKFKMDIKVLNGSEMSYIRVHEGETLLIRCIIPPNAEGYFQRHHSLSRGKWTQVLPDVKMNKYQEDMGMIGLNFKYTQFEYEQVRCVNNVTRLAPHYYVYWSRRSFIEDTFPPDPLMESQTDLSGDIVELGDPSGKTFPFEVTLTVNLTIMCLAGLSMSTLFVIIYALAVGFLKIGEVSDVPKEPTPVEVVEETEEDEAEDSDGDDEKSGDDDEK